MLGSIRAWRVILLGSPFTLLGWRCFQVYLLSYCYSCYFFSPFSQCLLPFCAEDNPSLQSPLQTCSATSQKSNISMGSVYSIMLFGLASCWKIKADTVAVCQWLMIMSLRRKWNSQSILCVPGLQSDWRVCLLFSSLSSPFLFMNLHVT